MKAAYPIVMSQGKRFIVVFVPDFGINTQGKDTPDAMAMARDAIGLMGLDMEDDGDTLPVPSTLESVAAAHPGESVTLVDIDFADYRRRNDHRSVRRNVSLPAWLNAAADQAGINVSAVLQNALKEELKVRLP